MAKAKKAASKLSAESKNYSVRFTVKQLTKVEEAAKKTNCSTAKFIREAAVRRAVDVMNSQSDKSQGLRSIIRSLVSHIIKPTFRHSIKGKTSSEISTQEYAYNQDGSDLSINSNDDKNKTHTIYPGRPHYSTINQFKRALESCGTEAVRIMLEEWESENETIYEYSPVVDADQLLSGDES